MKSYGQYCPIARATEILGERWTLLILRDILGGVRRFNDLRKGVPRMSPTLLSNRLKSLQSNGLIIRRLCPDTGAVEYLPTQAGQEVLPIIEFYGVWGQRWVRNTLGNDELDISLFMWCLRCGFERQHFPPSQSVVHFKFTDRPRLKMDNWWADKWWLIITDDEIDLCIQDPGHDVDLYVISDLATMTRVSMGDIPLRRALETNAIELHGSSVLEKAFEHLLPRSHFADVPPPSEPLNVVKVLNSLDLHPAG